MRSALRAFITLVFYVMAAVLGAPAWAAFLGASILAYQALPEPRPAA